MAISKQKKAEIIGGVEASIKDAQSIVFVSFKKLTVADATDLRRRLRAENVEYKVAKKTLLKRALNAEKFGGEMPVLDGAIAIAYGTDLLAPAREVFEFARTHKESVSIVGGVFDGRYMDSAEMNSIATIPGMQTLRAQFVNLINSPLQGLVIALDAIAETK